MQLVWFNHGRIVLIARMVQWDFMWTVKSLSDVRHLVLKDQLAAEDKQCQAWKEYEYKKDRGECVIGHKDFSFSQNKKAMKLSDVIKL